MTGHSGSATALAPPNIALVKYWGKVPVPGNLPAVSSLSMTLSNLATRTSVTFDPLLVQDRLILNGTPVREGRALARVGACLDHCRRLAGVHTAAEVVSHNNFPTGVGLASSAAGFAALVVAVDKALGLGLERPALSRLARRASGSAARSLFGGFVELPGADTDQEATAHPLLPPEYWPLHALLLIVAKTPKKIGSSEGMEHSRQTSAFYRGWLDDQDRDLQTAKTALRERDFPVLAEVAEANCLKMHALALSARPGILYWQPATLACMQRVRELRACGLPVFFSIDAGPQVKAFCPPGRVAEVAEGLRDIPGVLDMIPTQAGPGARVISADDGKQCRAGSPILAR